MAPVALYPVGLLPANLRSQMFVACLFRNFRTAMYRQAVRRILSKTAQTKMIDIASLRDDKPRFTMQVANLGEVRCYSIGYRLFIETLRSGLKNFRSMEPLLLVQALFSSLAVNSLDKPFSAEQVAALSDADLEKFTENVVANHVSIFDKPDNAKRDNESNVERVARVLLNEAKKRDALFVDRTPLRAPKIFIPPNPLTETNVQLTELNNKFEASRIHMENLFEAVRGVNMATQKLVNEAVSNAHSAQVSLRVAQIALAVAIIMPTSQILYDVFKSPDMETKRAIERLDENNRSAQAAELIRLQSAINQAIRDLGDQQSKTMNSISDSGRARDKELTDLMREMVRLLKDGNSGPPPK